MTYFIFYWYIPAFIFAAVLRKYVVKEDTSVKNLVEFAAVALFGQIFIVLASFVVVGGMVLGIYEAFKDKKLF